MQHLHCHIRSTNSYCKRRQSNVIRMTSTSAAVSFLHCGNKWRKRPNGRYAPCSFASYDCIWIRKTTKCTELTSPTDFMLGYNHIANRQAAYAHMHMHNRNASVCCTSTPDRASQFPHGNSREQIACGDRVINGWIEYNVRGIIDVRSKICRSLCFITYIWLATVDYGHPTPCCHTRNRNIETIELGSSRKLARDQIELCYSRDRYTRKTPFE